MGLSSIPPSGGSPLPPRIPPSFQEEAIVAENSKSMSQAIHQFVDLGRELLKDPKLARDSGFLAKMKQAVIELSQQAKKAKES